MNWLRLHSEARSDKKLATLTDSQHRVWFNLLCIASEQTFRGTFDADDLDILAIEVAGGDVELLTATLERLARLRIITTLPHDPEEEQHAHYGFVKPFADFLVDGDPIRAEWNSLRRKTALYIFTRDDYTCTYCGAVARDGVDLTVDHVNPITRGGTNDTDNLTTACRSCNSSKNNRTLKEWQR